MRRPIKQAHRALFLALQADAKEYPGGVLLHRYPSRADAVREGFRASCISECCNGTQKSHKGYRWRHVVAQQQEGTV